MAFDRRIVGGCSNRRPDVFIDLGHKVIVVEVDENQHELYDCSCENKRLMQLSADIDHRPLVIIRFNPDDYLRRQGECMQKVTSCWGINKSTGAAVLKKIKTSEWSERLSSLKTTIDYWLENDTEKTIEVVHLFFDENK